MKKTTLLIMAAGLGSRYGGNKQVDGIGPNGEILMQYSIYDAIAAGFNKIVFVIKPEHRSIIEGFCKDIRNAEVDFVYQEFSSVPSFYMIPEDRVKPFGTVHAVLCAKDAINEPFAVINADDFYGRDAFSVMHERLVTLNEGESAMVAYYLENTVSKNGAVTRGICEVEKGTLRKVKETYKIVLDSNGKISDEEQGELDGKLLVSMNMWGFMPDIFEKLDDAFSEFLSEISEGDIKAEYALPTFIDKMITEKQHKVYVLSTSAVWFGVTYIEDRASVAAALLAKRDSGEYPERLF